MHQMIMGDDDLYLICPEDEALNYLLILFMMIHLFHRLQLRRLKVKMV